MNRTTEIVKRTLILAGLVLACAVALYPALMVVKKSLEPGPHFALSPVPWPQQFSLEHYQATFTAKTPSGDLRFLVYAKNSLLLAVATSVLGLAFAAPCAYALSRLRFWGKSSALRSFILVQMFPSVMLLIPLYVLLDKLGLLNSLFGLSLVYATTAIPFCVWTLKGYFDSLPVELEEAARIDGASPWRIFFQIILPLAKPGLAVTGLFAFMTAWNEFILASTFLTDESKYTLPILLKSAVNKYSADWGLFAAGAVITSVPVMALFYQLQKHLVGGLTAGGVKS